MNKLSRIIVKNLVVIGTLSLTAYASWAVTGIDQPQVEITARASHVEQTGLNWGMGHQIGQSNGVAVAAR